MSFQVQPIRNEKMLEIKCFSIISMNLNPKFQVQNQDFAFYHPRLLEIYTTKKRHPLF